jgi:hypothetical protein
MTSRKAGERLFVFIVSQARIIAANADSQRIGTIRTYDASRTCRFRAAGRSCLFCSGFARLSLDTNFFYRAGGELMSPVHHPGMSARRDSSSPVVFYLPIAFEGCPTGSDTT